MELAIVILIVFLLFTIAKFFRARDYAARGIAASVTAFIEEEVKRQRAIDALYGGGNVEYRCVSWDAIICGALALTILVRSASRAVFSRSVR